MKLIKKLAVLLAACSLWAQGPKIHSDLAKVSPEEMVHVIVRYRNPPAETKNMRVRALGGSVHHDLSIVRGHAISVSARQLEKLAEDADVESITVDHVVSATLDTAAVAINAPAAWSVNQVGSGIGVAVIDSGVSAHPDLNGRVVYNQDFTGEGQNADLYGHGTHVAVAIAGSGARSTGQNYFKTLKGIAPGVNILNLRVLNSHGVGTDSAVIAAIQKAISLKAKFNIRVINLSLGRPINDTYKNDALCQAVESAWKSGIVVVVAAGNYGRTQSHGIDGYGTITAPGNDPFVITVGAMKTMGTPSRGDDLIASYSSKGPTLYDHIVKPDLVAPGNQIRSGLTTDKTQAGLFMSYPTTQFPCSYYQQYCGTGSSQDYYVLNGTSMAAPMVSAAAAILIGANNSLRPDQVKARLMKTAYKAFPASSTVSVDGVSYSSYYDVFTVGAGYLDIQAALSNQDLAAGNALSPTATYNPTTDTGSLTYAYGSAFKSSGTFGSSLIWGTGQFVNGTSLIWGTANVWSTNIVWGTAGPHAFSLIWGTSNTGTDAASIIWGDSIQSGAINPLIAVLTKGE